MHARPGKQALLRAEIYGGQTYILGNQAGNHHKGCFGFGQDGRGAQDIAIGETHREAEVFGTAMVKRSHDALGNFAVAIVKESLAASQYLRGGRLVNVLAPVGWGVAVGLIRQVHWNSLLEFLQGVDSLFARRRLVQRRSGHNKGSVRGVWTLPRE